MNEVEKEGRKKRGRVKEGWKCVQKRLKVKVKVKVTE